MSFVSECVPGLRHVLNAALWAFPLMVLQGCGNGDNDYWQQYHQQLGDAVNSASIENTQPDNIPSFPETQDLVFEIKEMREGMLNIYALRGCQITSLIAARNNQLGKVAPPSQQWLYERELWQQLSNCWNTDTPEQLSEEDQERLRDMTLNKTEQLPYVSWNAIFESSEWQKSFSRASQPLESTTLEDISAELEALDYLQRMTMHQFDRQWEQDSSRLENHLKELNGRPLSAEILRALLLASQRLDEASLMLEQADAECLPDWDMAYVQQLENVADTWLEAINQLVDRHPIEPPEAWQDYQQNWLSLTNDEAPWHVFNSALNRHQAIRSQFTACSS